MSADADRPEAVRHVPGEVGAWVFIVGDMALFAVLFGVTMYTRGQDPAVFDAGQETLHLAFGVINTLLLLCSSLFVVYAVRAARSGAGGRARRFVVAAAGCGALFALNKVFEYRDLLAADHTPASSDFYTSFFVLTGIHLLHLITGLAVLAVMYVLARREPVRGFAFIEGGGCYWHMVDLLWIVLFALFYLVQ